MPDEITVPIEDVLAEHADWSRRMFAGATWREQITKLAEEIAELATATTDAERAAEAADVVLAVQTMCALFGLDLERAVHRKAREVWGRQYRRDGTGEWTRDRTAEDHPMPDTSGDFDCCRPVTLPDGETIRVRGGGEMFDEATAALGAIIAAARERFATHNPDISAVLAQVVAAVEKRATAEDSGLRSAATQAGVSPAVLIRASQGAAGRVTVAELDALASWAGVRLVAVNKEGGTDD